MGSSSANFIPGQGTFNDQRSSVRFGLAVGNVERPADAVYLQLCQIKERGDEMDYVWSGVWHLSGSRHPFDDFPA